MPGSVGTIPGSQVDPNSHLEVIDEREEERRTGFGQQVDRCLS
jgi:hypothetical protein